MSRHTPGPWRALRGATEWRIENHRGHWLATAAVTGYGVEEGGNGPLIAAAPDLLAALQRVAAALEQGRYPELQGVACDVFAAIAKAEANG